MYRYDGDWRDAGGRYGRRRGRRPGYDLRGGPPRYGYDARFRGEEGYRGQPDFEPYGFVRGYDGRMGLHPGARHRFAEHPDGLLRGAVYRSLLRDGYLDAGAIEVEVDRGVVTLRGEVQDYMQARYAWDDAWDAPGVRGVVSRLTVAEEAGSEREEGAERR